MQWFTHSNFYLIAIKSFPALFLDFFVLLFVHVLRVCALLPVPQFPCGLQICQYATTVRQTRKRSFSAQMLSSGGILGEQVVFVAEIRIILLHTEGKRNFSRRI